LAVTVKSFFTTLSIFGIFTAGMVVGQLYAPFNIWLYALYVIIYTGAVFMVGIYAGQRSEKAWTLKREAFSSLESQKEVSDSREVGHIAEHR